MPALSTFLGRDDERAWLASRVASHRLVTVVGPGGIGKTRLVGELLARDDAGFAGGVHRCELAAIAPRDEIASEVAGQLGVPSLDALVVRLGDEPALLVLDNCEHLLGAAARLAGALLAAAPSLHVLATSREPLGLDGEEILVLGPLALPATADAADVEAAPATRLFEDRARAAGARRDASPAERAAVVDLCRRLDGVPLAIELAAARARSLTAVELLAHLGRRFDLLQRAAPVGQARHRSLRAAIDASYELLEPGERAFFRALGVFAGPFDAELAHAVAAPDGFDRLDTVDLLARLVDRSLVTAEPVGGATRYGLLDSLRHYAVEQADAAGEAPALAGRFVEAMLARATSIIEAGLARWSAEVLAQVFAQLGNLVAALERCCEIDADAARAFRLVLPLWGAVHQGRAAEVFGICERVLVRWPAGDEPLRAEAVAIAASAALSTGRIARAEELAERAEELASALQVAPVLALRVRGVAARHRGDVAAAAAHYRRGVAAAEAVGLAPFARELAVCAAVTEGAGGGLDAALASLAATSAASAQAGDAIGVVWAETCRAHLLVGVGRDAAARSALAAAEQVRGSFSYPYGETVTVRLDAALRSVEGGWPAAAAAWRHAIDVAAGVGDLTALAVTLRTAAVVAGRAGDRVSASLLAAAVPPGEHASVTGDVFDERPVADPDAAATTGVASPGALLRRVRNRLDALSAREADEPLVGEDAGRGAVATGSATARGLDPAAPAAGLLRDGDAWTVRFAGRTTRVRHLKGLDDLAALLARPDEELHCLELVGGVIQEGDTGPLLDAAARRDVEARIRALQEDVAGARAANDVGRAERAEAELDALVEQLSAAFGLGGRARRTGGAAERARSTVAWRLRAAVKRIAEVHPELGRHLDNAVRTGVFCSYRPEVRVAWEVRAETPHGRSA